MQIEQIVASLVAERNRLDAATQALGAKRRGRPPGKKVSPSTVDNHAPKLPEAAKAPAKPKHKISAAGRRAMAAAAKKRWAAIKAGKAPNPFAKAKGRQLVQTDARHEPDAPRRPPVAHNARSEERPRTASLQFSNTVQTEAARRDGTEMMKA
jgi:hypothetical protein